MLGIVGFSIFSIATILAIIMSIISEIQNECFKKRPYPSNKMLMTYEFRKLNYNWNTNFVGKFDMLVGYYAILSITILLVCISIISMGVIALFMVIFRHLPY